MKNKKTVFITLFFSLLLMGTTILGAASPSDESSIESNSDLTQTYVGGAYPLEDLVEPNNPPQDTSATPPRLDWRNAEYNGKTGNWLTPVHNQGDCGSCWAYAATATLEAMVNIQKGNPDIDLDLSEQQLVSCCTRGCNGCNGGSTYLAWDYLMDNEGAVLESMFPYRGVDANGCYSWKSEKCDRDPITCDMKEDNWDDFTVPVGEKGYYSNVDFPLVQYVLANHGPVATYMLIYSDFRYYNGGVYTHSQNADIVGGHAVTIVGYDAEQEYLICKNSWGRLWGEDGYFRIPHGECLLGTELYYVEVDSTFNFPPQAHLDGPYQGGINQTIQFSSMGTTDLDNNIVSYEWDFGDGSTSSNPNPEHSYEESGIYPVILTVTDEFGKQSIQETAAFIDMWDVNDYWVYDVTIDTIPDALYPPIRLPFEGTVTDVRIAVKQETQDTYVLDVTGTMQGNLSFQFDIQKSLFDLRAWSKIRRGTVDGSLTIDKKGFGLEDYEITLKGFANTLAFPIIPVPLWIPAPFEVTIGKNFEESRPLMTKAPSMGSTLFIPSVNATSEMMLSLFFGLISQTFQNTEYVHESTFDCIDETMIQTKAGSFDCYQYSINGDDSFKELDLFYAPLVRNIVKISGGDTDLFSYTGELVETNVNKAS